MEKYIGRTILVVEDDNISRALFRELFRESGCQMFYARNAAEAREFIEQNPSPDLILLDIRLPDMNGIQLAENLLKIYPHLTIAAQTAFAYQDLEEECHRVGMKYFITKPIQMSKLNSMLKSLGW